MRAVDTVIFPGFFTVLSRFLICCVRDNTYSSRDMTTVAILREVVYIVPQHALLLCFSAKEGEEEKEKEPEDKEKEPEDKEEKDENKEEEEKEKEEKTEDKKEIEKEEKGEEEEKENIQNEDEVGSEEKFSRLDNE